MQAEIRVKVAPIAQSGVNSEKDVVYLLVELRKLMDRDGIRDNHKTLEMFCDWIVHFELSRFTNSQAQVLQAFDDFLVNGSSVDAYTTMSLFRTSLQDFLIAEGLPTNITDDDQLWSHFLVHYSGVISDCPVRVEPIEKKSKLKSVKSVTVIGSIVGAVYIESREEIPALRWVIENATGDDVTISTLIRPIVAEANTAQTS